MLARLPYLYDKALRSLRHALCQVLLLVTVCIPYAAQAFQPFVVSDIRVEGMQRTEPGSIFAQLPFKVGQRFTEELATESVRKLYATGLYADVRIQTANRVVVVVVQERPTIAAITFTGMKEFETDAILGNLKQVGFSQGRVFDQSMLEQAQFELRQAYLNKGKYAVEISPTVTPLPRNRVGVNFDLFEGGVARIREINIVGNSAFSQGRLRDLMSLTTPGWLTWYTSTDKYSREKL